MHRVIIMPTTCELELFPEFLVALVWNYSEDNLSQNPFSHQHQAHFSQKGDGTGVKPATTQWQNIRLFFLTILNTTLK